MERKIFKDSIEISISKELKLFIRSMAASYQFIFQQENYDFVQRTMVIEPDPGLEEAYAHAYGRWRDALMARLE